MASYIYKTVRPGMTVWVYNEPAIDSDRIGIIDGDDSCTVNKIQDDIWLHISKLNGTAFDGWVRSKENNSIVMRKISTIIEQPKETTTNTNKVDEKSTAYVPDYDMLQITQEDFMSGIDDHFKISNLRGIFGMPYQFMASVDPRITSSNTADPIYSTNSSIGRKYAKEIVSTMPLLLMSAGKPVFMGKYSDKQKTNLLKQIVKIAGNEDSSDITNIVLNNEKFGKYYSLESAHKDYFEYVNAMCNVASRIMNVHDVVVDGTRLGHYNWMNKANDNFTKLFSGYRGCTAWYCQSDSSISDNFSNGLTDSIVGSKINSVSDIGREVNFLMGSVKYDKGSLLDKFTDENALNSNIQNVNDFINNKLAEKGTSGIFNSITNAAATVALGGKLVFPQLWSDFNFSRDYSINLKFVSPDGDDLSIYLNIIVPMIHLLALALPREAAATHGYMSPFLVRAFYKGLFNVDMGIITSLSFEKGKEGAWTNSGLPTVVEANFTITDLYNDMYMSKNGRKRNILNNIILMDYIANLCGVNINEPDIYRAIELIGMQFENRVADTWRMKIWGSLDQWVTNKWQNLFGRF